MLDLFKNRHNTHNSFDAQVNYFASKPGPIYVEKHADGMDALRHRREIDDEILASHLRADN